MKSSVLTQRDMSSASIIEDRGDVSYGQIVLVSARWILVVVALVLTVWDPAQIGTLRVQLLMIFLMAGMNFYLHAQTLMRKSVPVEVIYGASAVDLVVVTLFVLINGGFKSPLFTFYFPAIVAFAVVFPTGITAVYTGATAMFYFLIGLASLSVSLFEATDNTANMQVLVSRVIILVAIAVCGNLFYHIERGRRAATTKAYLDLKAEIEKRSASVNE